MGSFYSDIEIGLIVGFISIIATMIGYYFFLDNKYDNLKTDYYSFKKDTEKTLLYSENRTINHDLDLLGEALINESNCEILILGINALGILHQGYEKLIDNLNRGNMVKILLLSPDEDGFFGERIKTESSKDTNSNYKSTRTRLISEWNASMMIIADISQKTTKSKLLSVRKYVKPVTSGITGIVYKEKGIDEFGYSKAMLNSYSGLGRGYQNKQFLCRYSIKSERLTFKRALECFNNTWDDAIDILNYNDELIQIT